MQNGEYARAINYTGTTINSKTLVSWVTLADLDLRRGSALTIDTINVVQFDGIVWAERVANNWMAGSSFFTRTQDIANITPTIEDQ